MTIMLPREAELVSEWTGLAGEESVKRFERSNGVDTALYKTIPFYAKIMSVWTVQVKRFVFGEQYVISI